jgi:hypothetical protein
MGSDPRTDRPTAGAAAARRRRARDDLVVLAVTDLLSDGLSIDGALDWILATLIVWLATLLYDVFDERLQRLALRGIRDEPEAGWAERITSQARRTSSSVVRSLPIASRST